MERNEKPLKKTEINWAEQENFYQLLKTRKNVRARKTVIFVKVLKLQTVKTIDKIRKKPGLFCAQLSSAEASSYTQAGNWLFITSLVNFGIKYYFTAETQ